MIPERAPKRVVVLALDASPHSLAALEAGAEVAVAMHAELRGVFIEDINLMRTAELPFSQAVSLAGSVAPLDREAMRHGLQRRADIARIALQATAVRMRLIWSFDVVRGSVADELLRASTLADLMTLGRSGWSQHRAGLGSTTRSLLEEGSSSLLFAEHGQKLGTPIAVIYDGSDAARRALGIAASLVRGGSGQVIVILDRNAPEGRAHEASTLLMGLGVTGIKFQNLLRIDAQALSDVLRSSQTKGVLIPASAGIDSKGIARVLELVRCPAMVVR
jgi:hypothetical protein